MVDPKNTQETPAQEGGLMHELQAEMSNETTPMLNFLLKNRLVLMGIIGLLILVIIGTGIFNWRKEKALEEANMQLGKVLISTSGKDRVAALQEFLPKAPDSMQLGILLEIASSSVEAKDYETAANTYAEIAQKDAKGSLGFIAKINQIDVLLRASKATEALELAEKTLPTAPESMRIVLQESLAAIAEQAGNKEKAIAAYEALLGNENLSADTGYFESRLEALKAQDESGKESEKTQQ